MVRMVVMDMVTTHLPKSIWSVLFTNNHTLLTRHHKSSNLSKNNHMATQVVVVVGMLDTHQAVPVGMQDTHQAVLVDGTAGIRFLNPRNKSHFWLFEPNTKLTIVISLIHGSFLCANFIKPWQTIVIYFLKTKIR